MKLRTVAGLMLTGTLLLTACSAAPSATDAVVQEEEAGVVTLRVMALYDMDKGLTEAIGKFQETHDNVRIELVRPTIEEYRQGNPAAQKIAEGTVDVVTATGDLITQQQLLPLDPYLQKYGLEPKAVAPLVDGLRRDGKIFDLPWYLNPSVIFYNPGLVAKGQVPSPLTWDELRQVAVQSTRNGVIGLDDFYGRAVYEWLEPKWEKKPGIPDPKDLTAGLSFFHTLAFTDKAMAPAPPLPEIGAMMPSSPYELGKAAMLLADLRSRDVMKSVPFKWDVAPPPVHPGGKARAAVRTFGIAVNSRHPNAAFQFLHFLMQPQAQMGVAKAGVLPLYRTRDIEAAWLEQEPKPSAGLAALITTDWYVQPRLPKPIPERERKAPLNEYVDQVMQGKKSVADAVAEWDKSKP